MKRRANGSECLDSEREAVILPTPRRVTRSPGHLVTLSPLQPLRRPAATFAVVALVGIGLLSLAAPWVAPAEATAVDTTRALLLPGTAGHPLGTDGLGRDMWGRLLRSALPTLGSGILPAVAALAVGVTLGLLAGYYEGWVDTVISRAIDVVMAFPFLLLAITLVAVLGPSLINAMIAVSVGLVPGYVRLTRSVALAVKAQPFVEAARAMGASDRHILFRVMLHNVLTPAVAVLPLHIGAVMVGIAGLSFLGFGVQPPGSDWGAMIGDSRRFFAIAPHVIVIPSAAIAFVCFCFTLLGDELQDILDPHRRRTGEK